MGELEDRRAYTTTKTQELLDLLGPADSLSHDKACVYAIGSFGRVEAGEHSDLDLYIVGKDDGEGGSLLRPLDEICVKAELISAIRKINLPEFDGDGKYLVHYPVGELIKSIGEPDDDASNTFTARLLLLLESRPLLCDNVHQHAIERIISAYWRDYEDHKDDFIPAFLANDILRLWRTFCVNYEARTKTQPEDKKAKRKIKNYKLKHSRILTCYSALLYLLAIYSKKGTVEPSDAVDMSSLTPTRRLQWLLQQEDFEPAHLHVGRLLEQYETFLSLTNVKESDLVQKVMEKSIGKEFFSTSYDFGKTMFEAVNAVGNGSKFHRLIVV
jgi:hypothetical protein